MSVDRACCSCDSNHDGSPDRDKQPLLKIPEFDAEHNKHRYRQNGRDRKFAQFVLWIETTEIEADEAEDDDGVQG